MASTVTTATSAATAAMRAPEDRVLLGVGVGVSANDRGDPPPSDRRFPTQEQRMRPIAPRHHRNRVHGGDENSDDDDDGDGEEKKDARHNDPTPLHRNRSFFREQDSSDDDASLRPPSDSSEPQVERSNDDDRPSEELFQLDHDEPSNGKLQGARPLGESETPLEPLTRASPKKRGRRKWNAAAIERDASTAFSPRRSTSPLPEHFYGANDVRGNDAWRGHSKRRGKRRGRSRRSGGRDRRGEGGTIKEGAERGASKGGEAEGGAFASQNGAWHRTNSDANKGTRQSPTNDDGPPADPLRAILCLRASSDDVLRSYLPQLNFLDDHYYSRVRPYQMGRRDLPPNQVEVVLRRRAVRKQANAWEGPWAKVAGGGEIAAAALPRRPPPHQNTPPRRRIFPAQQVSPTSSVRGAGDRYEDDSTISSGTAASLPAACPMQGPLDPRPRQQPATVLPLVGRAVALPTEEVVGDTSLGIKLVILAGKVIVQRVTPLDDGRASPAQLCGALVRPGDVVIAVDGRSMVKGSVDRPVGMDRTMAVLKPLSRPINEATGEYSREVRLRLALGEGRGLLARQGEQERRRAEDAARRRRLGLVQGAVGMDPAADLFGIGAFAAADQRSGMPLSPPPREERRGHREEDDEGKEEKKDAASNADEVSATASKPGKEEGKANMCGTLGENRASRKSFTDRTTAWDSVAEIQAQIAHQVRLDRQFARKRNTSGFFSLNENAQKTLRPPSPPRRPALEEDSHALSSEEIRKQRLERGLQTMKNAESYVAVVERQDQGLHREEDEDPMEIASRACGTSTLASVRTGASRRRWHRGSVMDGSGGGVIAEENATLAAGSRASSIENRHPNFADVSTVRSGRSGRSGDYSGYDDRACDHRQLVELAANNDSWKRNVRRRLEVYNVERADPEEEGIVPPPMATTGATSIDSLFFGGDVANILKKKKQSLALPPGEMTSMLYDLVEEFTSHQGPGGDVLPEQILFPSTAHLPSLFNPEKVVSFPCERNEDIEKATKFLIEEEDDGVLGAWLKSFRPLPWKQRRALWPSPSPVAEGDYSTIMSSSRDCDNESLSIMSGTIATQRSVMDSVSKRNLREVIEDLELDHETRRETCQLVTFYFTQKFSNATPQATMMTAQLTKKKTYREVVTTVEDNEQEELAAVKFIDKYGSYLDIYKCLVFAGKRHSKRIVDGLVSVAKFDAQHKDALKALQKAKVLLFYETSMLSALLELLPTIAMKQCASKLDFIALLVSAYPDLQPWCIQDVAASFNNAELYMEYLSSLLHPEDGNDAAKRDGSLVKEWCSMLCSPESEAALDPAIAETYRQSFFNIAARENTSSLLYHRDLPFLLDISVRTSEFGLALSLANEMISNWRHGCDKEVLLYVHQHLCAISDKAIEGNEGEINTVLLAQVITFFKVISPRMQEHNCNFDNVAELLKLLEKCHIEIQNNPQYSPDNMDACITTISENAPPVHSLQILSQWEPNNNTTLALRSAPSSSSLIFPAIHTSLIRGAREGVRSELSGCLLRIQRAREEGRRPIVVENNVGAMMGSSYWNTYAEEEPQNNGDDRQEEDASGGFLWPSVLDGALVIAK